MRQLVTEIAIESRPYGDVEHAVGAEFGVEADLLGAIVRLRSWGQTGGLQAQPSCRARRADQWFPRISLIHPEEDHLIRREARCFGDGKLEVSFR